MSGAATDDPRERYSGVEALPRRKSVPIWALGLLIVVILMGIGLVVRHFTARFTDSGEGSTNSAAMLRLGPPPDIVPASLPPAVADQRPPTHGAPPPPQATPALPQATVAQAVMQQFGAARDVLMLPPKGWGEVQRPSSSGGGEVELTDAERAAVATGGRPKPPMIGSTRATAIADLTRTIRPGAVISCTTQDAIDTSTGGGAFLCLTDHWILSWDLTKVIPPKQRIQATYKELRNGTNRIFAASALLTTDSGMMVPLGDPFTMADGSPGIQGVVQDNTWARIKEGVILDLTQSAFGTLPQMVSHGGGNNYLNLNTGSTESAMGQAIRQNANIADVLRLPAGAHVSLTIEKPIFLQDVVGFELPEERH